MYPFLAIITALMLFPLSLHAIEDNDKQENKARQTPRLLNDILPDLIQIIDTAGNTRFSNKKLSEDQKYNFLRNLVISLNPFMDLQKTKPDFNIIQSKSFPVKKLKQSKIFYFRIDSFSSKNIKPFMNATQNIIKNRKSPNGIILDLRNCSGFDNDNMHKVSLRSKALKLTIICLIGKKTSGAAELFAQTFVRSPKCISMGASTAGQPFEHKFIDLKSGFFLLIPQIPEFLKKLPQKIVKPTIPYTSKENCINAATDLLSVVKIH